MNQRTRNVLIVFALVIFSVITLSVTAVNAGPAATRTGVNPYTGKLSFLGASVASPLIVPEAVAPGLTADARAQAILNVYAPQFGVAPQNLAFTREFVTQDGRISRRYQQTYQGLQVYGAQLIVNMTRGGGLVSMVGKVSPDLAVGTVPMITAAQAQQKAVQYAARALEVSAGSLSPVSSFLTIYDARLYKASNTGAVIAYRVDLVSLSGAPVKGVALINGVNGNVLLFYNAIETGMNLSSVSNVASGISAQQISLPRADVELITNGGFEDATVAPWTVKLAVGDKVKCNTETKTVSHTGECAFQFKGGAGENTKLQQVVDISGETFVAGDTVSIDSFIKAPKAATSGKIKVSVAYSDSTPADKIKINITSAADYTSFGDSVTLAGAAVSKIKVMFINKSTGGKAYLDDVSLLHSTGGGGAADLATYDANNGTTLPGTFVCDETDLLCTHGTDTDADAAHLFADGVYNMYADWHGRDSLDDAGMQLISTVHFDTGYCNAGWTGEQMIYGDGCSSSIVLDDVVGHELTHGVTTFSSNLEYADQSGAINESFSDVWGEFFDITNNSGDETPENRWRVGEEIDFGYPQMGLRDMQDPTLFDNPDRMQSPLYYLGGADYGGVHTNSGVNNKAAYLMVDGDTFNGETVVGIGLDKTVQIYYDTQTTKLSQFSTYLDLYDALQQSCTELIGTSGITAADCDSVTGAVTATEMNLPAGAPADTAAVCPAVGDGPVTVFSDDLESGSANWTSGSISGTNSWTLADTTNVLVGTASNYGEDLGEISASFAAMASSVAVPANAYLHFDHNYSFERGSVSFYDGGIIEYSTDNGTTWTQLPSAGFYEDGLDYGGVISSSFGNPLGGKSAFVGFSGSGAGSTRYTLSTLSGQNVRFRWVVGSDDIYGDVGWLVDNVMIYTCAPVAVNSGLTGRSVLPLPAPSTSASSLSGR